MKSAARVLLVDDELNLLSAYAERLQMEGMEVATARSASEAISKGKKQFFDVAVLDIRLPDMDGIELLCLFKEILPACEVIMLTGHGSIDSAVRAMKLGACDYLTKPCSLSDLSSLVSKAIEKKFLKEKNVLLKEHLHLVGGHDKLIGESKAINEIRRLISLVANTDVPVLILGETGTGKEIVARSIHELSPRSANSFVAINSSTLQDSILESELFGYKKGAFTGAQQDKVGLLEIANNGSFFIDEMGDMSASIQAKLLRFLETGAFRKVGDTREITVDIRFICATNVNLECAVREKKFRQDLYYRLNVFVITVPPLRERRGDVALIANYFLKKLQRGTQGKRFSRDALKALSAYWWPGNVRELKNVVERALILSQSREEIEVSDLPSNLTDAILTAEEEEEVEKEGIYNLDKTNLRHIESVLNLVSQNKSKAARLLGVSRRKLYYDIKKIRNER